MLRHIIFILLLCASIMTPSAICAREYIITPQWQEFNTDFRQATISDNNSLSDSYTRMDCDTVNIIDTQTQGQYALNILFDITNLHAKTYANYPQYYTDQYGKKRKGKYVKCPVYGWVIGMKDMQHYSAIWMRAALEEEFIYENGGVDYRVVSINGNDTIYHTEWRTARFLNNVSNSSRYSMWIQYNNNSLWFGNEWDYDIPWDVVHNVPSYGRYTGLYLSAGANVRIDDTWIIVNDKGTQPHTQLTAETIDYYLNNNYCSPIEGFWKISLNNIKSNHIKMGGDYSLAIVNSGDSYNAIYIEGAHKYPNKWKEGDVKAVFKPTTPGFYEVEWYDAEGEKIENVLAFLSGDEIRIDFTDDKSTIYLMREDKYIKPSEEYNTKPSEEYNTKPSEEYNTKPSEEYNIGFGTGFAITSDGYIATNHHVIDDAQYIAIYDGNYNSFVSYNAVVVASDSINDLAILRIDDEKFEGFGPLPYDININTSRVGESVFYMGFPQPQIFSFSIQTSIGAITAEHPIYKSIYITSVDIDHGSSGSPLFDNNGNVIGVMSSMITNEFTSIKANIAVKSTYLHTLARQAGIDNKLHHENQIMELSHPDRIEAITPYVFLIATHRQPTTSYPNRH